MLIKKKKEKPRTNVVKLMFGKLEKWLINEELPGPMLGNSQPPENLAPGHPLTSTQMCIESLPGQTDTYAIKINK